MTRLLAALIALSMAFAGYGAFAENPQPVMRTKKTRKKKKAKRTDANRTLSSESPKTVSHLEKKEVEENDTRFYRFKLNTTLGMNVSQGSALVVAGQFGVAVSRIHPWYVGPEVNFSLFSPGSVLAVMGGAWYEMRVYGAPRMSVALGAVAGPAFTTQINNVSGTTIAAFFDGVIAQDIDDLVTVRGQFRPGIIGGYLAFQMNFNVCFRFL